MRKGYQVKTHGIGTSKRSKYTAEEDALWMGFNTRDGQMTFSYKGLVIDKRNRLYSVRDVKLEGFPVNDIAGVFTDTRTLRIVIDNGLLQSSPDKLERLRERNKNIKCGDCSTPFLFRRDMLIAYLGGKIIQCPYCYHEEFEDRLEWATDENFY